MDAMVARQMLPALEELKDYVSIPNDAVNPEDIQENVQWAEKAFAKRGFQTSVLKNARLPLFLAEMSFPKASKTVMFYFHLDGQPVRADEWQQEDPFRMVLREKGADGAYEDINWNLLQSTINDEWRVFGRSSSDDKGPIIMLLQALDMLQSERQSPPFNIKVVLDPEEEKGSPGLKETLEKHKDRFQADYLIVMDGPMHASNIPTLTLGCRGSVGFTLATYGPITPQHSGHYGNYAPNPGFLLAKVIASMKDEQGRVLVDGFYNGIAFDEEALKVMAAVPDNKEEINARLVIAEEEKVGNNYQESLQYPSLNIRGMQSAVVGKGAATIVPDEAVALLDIRLVPETEAKRMVSLVDSHIQKQGYTVLNHAPTTEERLRYPQIVFMQSSGGTPAFRTDVNAPISVWLRKALANSYKKEPVVIRMMGGTVPVVSFVQALDVPAVLVPLVNVDNNQHSPDENLRLGNLRMGMKTCLSILTSPI
ncbi:M20/M25/M40 family metallo-hydrolase [Pontibacter diazotrophicus]|nr:M20/M25/M40 family metallo-hydrolase [Pontibacter diazotrophicus]